MKVLIAGANGTTGRHIVEILAKGGKHEPYAMIRKEEQTDKMLELGAHQVVIADLEDDLDHAVKGMDAVIFAAGSGSKTGPDKTVAVDQNGARSLIAASKKADVHHFLMLSSMGADDPKGEIQHYLEAKAAADKFLIESGLKYTVVRPGALTNDAATGKVELQKHIKERKDRSIPREDVASIFALSLDTDNAKNKVFDALSGDQIIAEALKKID
jgi:uncharacterized protein YbjT (DUF2867 family)